MSDRNFYDGVMLYQGLIDDECQCSCHENAEEHSMCISNAKACTYSRGEIIEEEDSKEGEKRG